MTVFANTHQEIIGLDVAVNYLPLMQELNSIDHLLT
jgi:hypothetical protein